MTQRWLLLIPLGLFLLLVVALAAGLRQGGDGKFASHIGGAAPTTDLALLENPNARFTNADWRGRSYVVNFFASWCAPCHAEHPALMALAAAQIPVIGIAFRDKAAAVRAFLRDDGDPFVAVADDSGGKTGIDWGITGVPETYIIDRDGIIRFHQAGPLTEDMVAQQIMPLWREIIR